MVTPLCGENGEGVTARRAIVAAVDIPAGAVLKP